MARRGRPPHPDVLTPREWEVLGAIRDGLSNEQIAQQLNIGLDGVKYHVTEILTKLGLENRHDAARWRPGDRRPWWGVALLFWRRLGARWLSPVVAGALAVGIAAGVGVLVWALLATGNSGPTTTAALPRGDRLAYIGTDGFLWLLGEAPERIEGTSGANSLQWSPDGKLVLFMRNISGSSSKHWILNVNSSSLREVDVTQLGEQDGYGMARWAPDSQSIALLAGGGGLTANLWIADINGTTRKLLGADSGIVAFAWSPEGKEIALAISNPPAYKPTGGVESVPQTNGIYVVDASGGTPRPVVFVNEIQRAWEAADPPKAGGFTPLSAIGVLGGSHVWWAPDGRYLAFQPSILSSSATADGLPLFTIPVEGGTPVYHGIMLAETALLDWFSGGHRFAFTLGEGRDMYWGKRIAVAEAGVSGAEIITEDPDRVPGLDVNRTPMSARSDGWPVVSPDGTRIVFQASEARTDIMPRLDVGKIEGPKEGIWIVNADGSNPRQLTSDPQYLDVFPQWSAGSQSIMFVRTDGKQFVNQSTPAPDAHAEIWIMRANGSDARPLTTDLLRIGSYYGLFGWGQDLAWYRGS